MRCEYKQIPAAGVPGRLRGRLPGPPRTSTQIQPQEVHPAPTPGLPGAQGVLPARLPRTGRAPRRSPRPRPTDRPEGRAPLHDLPEGGRPAAGGRPGPQDVRRRARAGVAGPGSQAARPPGGRRWHGDGVAAYQPVLRQAAARTAETEIRKRLTPNTRRSSSWSIAEAT